MGGGDATAVADGATTDGASGAGGDSTDSSSSTDVGGELISTCPTGAGSTVGSSDVAGAVMGVVATGAKFDSGRSGVSPAGAGRSQSGAGASASVFVAPNQSISLGNGDSFVDGACAFAGSRAGSTGKFEKAASSRSK